MVKALHIYNYVGVCAFLFASIEVKKSQLIGKNGSIKKEGGHMRVYLCKIMHICVAVVGKGGFVPDGVIVVTAGVMPASL